MVPLLNRRGLLVIGGIYKVENDTPQHFLRLAQSLHLLLSESVLPPTPTNGVAEIFP